MVRAIFVNLKNIYPQLTSDAQRSQQSTALRHCTCGWWKVNPESAGDIRFAFGVYCGEVVSAYAVNVPVTDWPVMPERATARARRYIPVSDVRPDDWALAKTWRPIPMFGPVRYGVVSQHGDDGLSGFTFPVSATFPEETERDEQP